MNYEISNGQITATVSTYGAELVSVVMLGRERLWQNETGEWCGHAPVLFPVCGTCAMIVDGVSYPIAKHGFARRSQFEVVEKEQTAISLRLCSSEETKKVYPYEFELTVRYRLVESGIEVTYRVRNTGERALYFSCGAHESYALEGDLKEYELRLKEQEELTALLHDENGRLTGKAQTLAKGGVLPLDNKYFQGGDTLIFAGLKSKTLTLYRGSMPVTSVSFEHFENLLLWKPERAKMLCIEPWQTLPDAVGESAEFSRKSGVRCLASGAEAIYAHTLTYLS